MALVWPLRELGLDSCVISVEEIRTIDGEGASRIAADLVAALAERRTTSQHTAAR